MFREMRRKKQQLTEERSIEILHSGTSGVLALYGDDDYPYAVPLSYVYDNGKIYFHSAKTGHKIDAVKKHNKASFCVIQQDQIVPEEYTTYFRSVIAFGNIRIVDDEKEKLHSIEIFAKKYHPADSQENRNRAISEDMPPLCMLCLDIQHMTGKEAIEVIKK